MLKTVYFVINTESAGQGSESSEAAEAERSDRAAALAETERSEGSPTAAEAERSDRAAALAETERSEGSPTAAEAERSDRAAALAEAERSDESLTAAEAERSDESPAAAEAGRAVRSLKAAGISGGIISGRELFFEKEKDALAPEVRNSLVLRKTEACLLDPGNTLFLCDSGEQLRALRDSGFYAVGYSHEGNASERFRGASYIIQEPDYVDSDSYVKIYEREAGLPWTILQTPRCLVREFTVEDLDGIYRLYDGQASRWLEPPSDDRAHEREILGAYIDRIYRLYGFGHWAVLERDSGTLIGRIGFSAITAEQEAAAFEAGAGEADADFGFLVAASGRGRGIAQEVCAAILRFGFTELGFSRVSADAHIQNAASIRLLEKLGFRRTGQVGSKILFIREAADELCK